MSGDLAAVSGVLFDPETKSFLNFGEADFAMSDADAMDASSDSVVGLAFEFELEVESFTAEVTGLKLGFGTAAVNGGSLFDFSDLFATDP